MNRFWKWIPCIALLLSCLFPACGTDQLPSPDASWRNDFSVADNLETEWQFEGGKLWTPRTRFYIADEPTASAGKVMVVESDSGTGVMLTHPKGVNLTETPIMRWRWRLVRPVVLAEGKKEPDDQAVVMYFGDGSLLKQQCVGYRWESLAPIGATALLKYCGGMMTPEPGDAAQPLDCGRAGCGRRLRSRVRAEAEAVFPGQRRGEQPVFRFGHPGGDRLH